MIRATWGDVKSQLARVAGTSGMPVTDARLKDLTNVATQELMNEGDFPGVVDRWFILQENGRIILPSHLDRLMQITIGGRPRETRSPWYQFVQYGPGIQEDERLRNRTWCGPDVILDVGEVCSQNPIPISDGSSAATAGPWKLRVYASVPENEGGGLDPYCTVQGLDENGLIVRTQLTDGSGTWINGERIFISDGSSFTESVSEFSELQVFTKPATNGYVRLTAWNGTTEVELSNYEPEETTPSYHEYFSPWLQDRQTASDRCRMVLARCRRRFFPIVEDTDPLIISNLPALKEMIIAVWKREAGAGDEYALHKQTAVDILRKEAAAYRGKARVPSITFSRGFMIGSDLPPLR